MKGLSWCRHRLAHYCQEQLLLLEQSVSAWAASGDAAVQCSLAGDARECSRQLELLSTFLGPEALAQARQLKKLCLLLLNTPEGVDGDGQNKGEGNGKLQDLCSLFTALAGLHEELLKAAR